MDSFIIIPQEEGWSWIIVEGIEKSSDTPYVNI